MKLVDLSAFLTIISLVLFELCCFIITITYHLLFLFVFLMLLTLSSTSLLLKEEVSPTLSSVWGKPGTGSLSSSGPDQGNTVIV